MPTHTILPGVNALGCGFNPFVDTATQYKPTLLTFDYAGDAAQYQNANAAGTYTDAAETQYSVPKGVTINPGGAGSQESGDVYESRQEVEESFAAKAGVSGGFGLFSGSVNASYSTSTKATQESYFCRKWRHVSLWSLSLSEHLVDLNKAVDPRFIEITKALPSGHKTEAERKKWDTFFDRYGTHYIAGCQVGGEATLTVTLQKSQKSTKQSVQADMEIAYGSYFKGTGSASRDKTSDDFRKNSHINKIFEGGKPTSVDPENDPNALDAWANTVIDTPASRDFTMQPIWKLFPDTPAANAAEAAFADYCYRNSQYSVKFNDKNAHIDVTKQNGFSGFEEMCVEAWIYPTGKGTGGNHGGIIVNKEHAFELARGSDGTLRYAIEAKGGPVWTWQDTKAKLPRDEWWHLALTCGKDKSKGGYHVEVFVNGNSVYRAAAKGPVKANTNKMTIGDRISTDQGFQGFMQEVRLWQVNRQVAEIQENMYNRLTGDEPGLVGLWTLNDAHSDTARDLSPNGNTGKLRKAVWGVPPLPSPLTSAMTSPALRTDEMKAVLAQVEHQPVAAAV